MGIRTFEKAVGSCVEPVLPPPEEPPVLFPLEGGVLPVLVLLEVLESVDVVELSVVLVPPVPAQADSSDEAISTANDERTYREINIISTWINWKKHKSGHMAFPHIWGMHICNTDGGG
jgi:hypothetical protein